MIRGKWQTAVCSFLTMVFLGGIAEAATISGYVREAGSQESMPYVSVFIQELRIGATTNPSGYYVITGVPPGRLEVSAALIGYERFTRTVDTNQGDVTLDVILQQQSLEVEAVTVEAERVEQPSLEITPSRVALRGADLKAGPILAEPDPVRTLQTLPGVLSLSDFNVGLYVRGGTPDQNLIRVDGADLYNVSHFFGLFSTFPADAIKSAELISGGYPAQYGGRLSSVLNVLTDEGNKQEFHGTGGISLISSRLTLEGPVGRGSWLISGRRTYLEPILAIASKWNDGFDKFGYHFYDTQGKIHQILNREHQLTFAFYLGRDYLRYDELTLDATLDWGNRSVSATWTYLPAPELFVRVQGAYSRFRSHSQFEMEDVGFQEWNKLTDLNGKVDLTWFASDGHTVEAGFEGKQHEMSYDVEIGDQSFSAFDMKARVFSAYVQDTYKPWPFLSFMPGFRMSHFTHGSYTDYNPRFAMRWQVGEDTFLKAAVGRYTQYLFRVSRNIQGINFLSDLWFTCDSTAAPSHATQYVAGIETTFDPDIEASLEWYYKDYDELAEFNDELETAYGSGDALKRGDGRAYGMELSLKKRSGAHYGWISYSLGWSIRNIEGINTASDGVTSQDYYPKFDRRHSLHIIYSYQFSDHWTFHTSYTYGSGQGYTEWKGRYILVDPLDYTWQQYLGGAHNAAQLPAYSRLDFGFRGNYRGWGINWMPFIEFINVTNRRNVFNRYWSEGDWRSGEPGTRQDLPQLPFMLTFGVDLEF